MLTVDTIKFKAPYQDYKKEDFHTETKSDHLGSVVSEKLVLNKLSLIKKYLGIIYICIYPDEGYVVIQVSAKILRKKYPDLISMNTIELVIHLINESGLLKLDQYSVLDEAEVLSLDVTKDIKTKHKIENIIRDFHIYSGLSNYNLLKYPNGIVTIPVAKSNKQRLTIYSKYNEYKSNLATLKLLEDDVPIETFNDFIRVEGNLKTFKDIRGYFQINDGEPIMLKSILTTSIPVLRNYFDKMFPPKKIRSVVADPLKMDLTPSKLFQEIGKRTVIEHCNYNRKTINSFIASLLGGSQKTSYYMKSIDELLLDMICEKMDGDFRTIEELRNKIAE